MKGVKHHSILRRSLFISLISALSVLFGGCPGNSEYRRIPVPPLQKKVYPYGMDNELLPIGGHKIFPNHGYTYNGVPAGILVYHFTESEYLAYDLACPNDYEYGCKATLHANTLTLTCEGNPACEQCKKGCGTVFNLLTGFPEKGYPNPLHAYKTQWDASNRTLLIYN